MDQWLRNTNVVKVVALVIGVLLWAVVRSSDAGTVSSTSSGAIGEENIGNVAITPKYDKDQFYVELLEPERVTVTLSGRDSVVKKVMTSGGYSVEVDLTQVGKGEYTLPLTPVGFPANVSVKVTPATVKVVVDEKRNKSMPVTVNVTGIPGVGLKAGQPVAKPSQVTVSVPSRIYDEVESVRTDVSVEKATSPVSNRKAVLAAYDKNGKKIETATITPNVVDVEVPITSPFTMVPLQVKLVGEPPAGYAVASIRQSTDKVTVYGPQNVLDKLEFYEGPQVELSNLKEDTEFTLSIPPKENVNQLDPEKIVVNVSIVPSVTKTLEGIKLSIIGQNDIFNTKVVRPANGTVDLKVEGAPTLIDKLKPQDVQAILDVSNLPPGTHEVPVTWNLPTFVKKGPGQEFKMSVEITAKTTAQPAPQTETPAKETPAAPQTTVPEPAAPQTEAPQEAPADAEQPTAPAASPEAVPASPSGTPAAEAEEQPAAPAGPPSP
ncbi:YbbR domain-containing protein [Paenibacillus mucilaginosus]|uniref:CdaR family protein n=1 Tax=Paenibacillus mucilaginosus TaxID=61624 RepID=UPI003D1D3734